MMKKILSAFLAITLVFALCACGEGNENLGGMGEGDASEDAPYLGKWIMTGNGAVVNFKSKSECIWNGRVAECVYDEAAGTVTVKLPSSTYTFEFGEKYGVECLIDKYNTLTREADYPTYRRAYAEEKKNEVLKKFRLEDTPYIELGKEYSPVAGVTFQINKMWVEAAQPNDMDYKANICVEYTVTNNSGDYLMFVISGWYYFFLPTHGSSLWGMDEAPLQNGATETRQAILYTIDPEVEHIQDTAEFGFISINTNVLGVQNTYLIGTETLASNK